MVGAVARNFHTASRSEILADFLFSGWGTVTPARRSDDYGVDLYCTLTESVGQRSSVTDYYSVQVKSNDDPWRFESAEEVRWLFDYPTPLFLACVDKTKTVLSVYHTLPRFLAGFWEPHSTLELVPTAEDEGDVVQWQESGRFSLSAPILRVSIDELSDHARMSALGAVFRRWVVTDSLNCDLARLGLLRFRMPYRYRVNEEPGDGFVEQGRWRPTKAQLDRAVVTLVEAVDCVGDQLRGNDDRVGALLAAMLLRHLRSTQMAALANEPRWNPGVSSALENNVADALNRARGSASSAPYLFAALDEVVQELKRIRGVTDYLKQTDGTT